MIVVSDTSAISALLTIHRAELLRDLFHEVLIPPAVVTELRRAHASLPAYLREVPVTNQTWEKLGRRIAQRAGLPVVGLLGVISEAKRAGLVPTVSEVIDQLIHHAGFYVSPSLRDKVLKAAQEQ